MSYSAKSKFFDLLPITSSLGNVRAPRRLVTCGSRRLDGGTPVSSAGGCFQHPLVGDLEHALEGTDQGIRDSLGHATAALEGWWRRGDSNS